jgi:murein DD-endopeptidase MepM/ murein hydrolase activator NlpD
MPIRPSLPFALLVIGVGCVSLPPAPPGELESPNAYKLPFRAGTRHLCIQGGPGPFGHTAGQRYALDFKMNVGTPIHAARAGRVVAVKQDSAIGGPSRKYLGHGNYVRIRHGDGTWAVYLHLMQGAVVVAEDQRVRRGELIAYSGNTGRSALPHLHFHVAQRDSDTGRVASVPVAFADVAGDGVPRPLWTYESDNEPPDPLAPDPTAPLEGARSDAIAGSGQGG